MQKSLYTFVIILLSACQPTGESQQQKDTTAVVNSIAEPPIDTGVMAVNTPPETAEFIPDTVPVAGHFDADTSLDVGYGVFYRMIGDENADGEEAESDKEMQYIVRFPDSKIRDMPALTGRHIRLVNEGDLNNDGQDEISVFEQSMRSCMYSVSTWSYVGEKWKMITDFWLMPTACDYFSDEDLQNRIVLEDGTVYYYETDVNDPNFALVKKELTILKP